MKGVILAAGKGTRLYPITRHIPKPLLPIANRPTIHYAFDRLKEIGVSDICVVVGGSGDRMKETLGDGASCGVGLTYVTQHLPQGLAHAVGYAKDFVAGDSFVLYLGDAIYGDGFQEYARYFKDSRCANLNLVKPVEDPTRFGVAYVDGDRIVKLVEKPPTTTSNLAMAGMYFFGPEIWSVLPDLAPSARGEYEITDAIQMLIDRGADVRAGVYEGTWFDTGTLDSFLQTSDFLIDGATLVEGDVDGEIGPNVVVGTGATVRCGRISNSVVFPDASVSVTGDISRSLLADNVTSSESIVDDICYGMERRSEDLVPR